MRIITNLFDRFLRSAVLFLRQNLPTALVDGNLANFFRDDYNVTQILEQLRETLHAEGRV